MALNPRAGLHVGQVFWDVQAEVQLKITDIEGAILTYQVTRDDGTLHGSYCMMPATMRREIEEGWLIPVDPIDTLIDAVLP